MDKEGATMKAGIGICSPVSYHPPMKKQRGGITPQNDKDRGVSKDTSDAIARRRQELARLQTSFQQRPKFGAATGSVSVDGGTNLASGASSSSSVRTVATVPASHAIPPQQRFVQPRKSDIFPSVPKSSSSAGNEQLAAMAAAAAAVTQQEHSSTPAIARRLEENFEKNDDPSASQPRSTNGVRVTRPASAPPRPPPPPPPPSTETRAPVPKPSSGASLTGEQKQQPPAPTTTNNVSRSYTGRPEPITPQFKKKDLAAQPENHNVGRPEAKFPSTPLPSEPSDTQPHQPPLTNLSTDAPPRPDSSAEASQEPIGQKKTSFAPTPAKVVSTEIPPMTESKAESTQLAPTKAFAGVTPFPKVSKPTAPAAHTPFVTKVDLGEDENQASTRKETLMRMRALADTPAKGAGGEAPEESPSQQEASAILRLQKQLAQSQKEKTNALRQVKELEETLEELKKRESEKVAQQTESPSTLGFLSPVVQASIPSTPSLVVSPMPAIASPPPRRRRVPTPFPKKREMGTETPENTRSTDSVSEEEQLRPFLIEAAADVSYEYESEIATFLVRRPYGAETDQDLWFENGEVGSKVYQQSASVYELHTIEVVAMIRVDGSTLLLHGEDSVRHGSRDGAWEKFPNCSGGDTKDEKPLGNVTYIDAEANELTYSLDDLYENALSIRQIYGSSLHSFAMGLQKKSKDKQVSLPEDEPPMMVQEIPATPTFRQEEMNPPVAAVEKVDTSVDTEGLLPPKAQPQVQEQVQEQMPPPEPQKPIPAPQEDSNVLGVFVAMIISLFWNALVVFPLRILSTILTWSIAIGFLAFIWLYLREPPSLIGGATPIAQLLNPAGIA